MKNFKSYFVAAAKIGEKILLIAIGLAGLWAHFAKLRDESLSTLTLVIAVTALAFGLAPMVYSYARNQWPKKPLKAVK